METPSFGAFTDTWTWDDAAADRLSTYLGAVARPAHNAVIGLYRMLGECGMLAYLTYMAERLEQCHRLLKPTGSIYLHCDDTAGAYLRALMDAIFEARNFRNEIIWKRTTARSDAQRFGRVHDVILFYGAGEPTWNPQYEPYDRNLCGGEVPLRRWRRTRSLPAQRHGQTCPGMGGRDV